MGKKIGWKSSLYGSKKCRNSLQKGRKHPHSKATKEKIRNSDYHKNSHGKNSGGYIDGRCSKKYYCIESNCNNEISYGNWIYGIGIL